ncbi:MAG: ATP-binding protein [Chthoniobacter sp.]
MPAGRHRPTPLEQRLQQKEKSALLDTLAGGIAHELNNKLLPVLGYAEMLQLRARGNAELSGWCEVIRQSTIEAAELTGQLLQLSRPPALEPRACDLVAIVHAAMNMIRFRLRDLGCEPVLDLPSRPMHLHADPAQLKQVIVNLCFNAIDSMAACHPRRLHLSLLDEEEGVCLRVQDSGGGIPEEYLARIFDPFFTTKGRPARHRPGAECLFQHRAAARRDDRSGKHRAGRHDLCHLAASRHGRAARRGRCARGRTRRAGRPGIAGARGGR